MSGDDLTRAPRFVDGRGVDATGPVSIHHVIAALGRALAREPAEPDLAAVFEREVQQMMGMRAVRLREIPARYQVRLVTPTRTAESVVLGVPTADPRTQAVLEASCGPDRVLDEWDYRVLTSVAHLGGLVLEACKGRPAPPRATPEDVRPLIGESPIMQRLRSRIERVAVTDFTVLIEGESGTGKELVARQLHESSRRRHGPFVAINCAAVVDSLLEAELFGIEERTATGVRGRRGKFEHADGGTLFLDEVSDLSSSAQAKLLRAIQDLAVERVGGQGARRVNTRILAATNRPLADLVARGLFRADLYYRLGGIDIAVPPLRHRPADIPELARYFLDRHRTTRDLALSTEAEEALCAHAWPGNVRELQRAIERAVALAEGDRIELADLPAAVSGRMTEVLGPALASGDTMRTWGSRYARLIYERCGRRKRVTCQVLDISYHTLQSYLRHADGGSPDSRGHVPSWVQSISDPARLERSRV